MRLRSNLNKIPARPSSDKIRNTYQANVIFVEGRNDKKVIESVIKKPWVVRIYGEDTRHLRDIKNTMMEDFKSKFNQNQIAIVDKDYDCNENINNLFYTDFTDIECTALNLMTTDEVRKALNIETSVSDNEFINKCLNPVLNYSNKFSLLWKYSKENNLRIPYFTKNINAIPYLTRMLNVRSESINYDVLKDIYLNVYHISNVDFKNVMEEKNDSNNFRGHDFFKILSIVNSINGIKLLMLTDDIEGKFIDNSCRYRWIEKSELYTNIKNKYPNCFE